MKAIAITREVSEAIGRCELTHLSREGIDVDLARLQHSKYEERLEVCGCTLLRLEEEPDLPDSVFVEDTAIVLDEIAVMTRPGAESRRNEVESVSNALLPFRKTCFITEPGTLDGGDVLVAGEMIYVGLSRRSNAIAVEQLGDYVRPFGYHVKAVEIDGCLHLKSAVTCVADNVLLVNGEWVDCRQFGSVDLIEVDPAEPFGANALRIGKRVIYPQAFPLTGKRMEERGITIEIVDVSELARAEGGVTCCSLVFRDSGSTVK